MITAKQILEAIMNSSFQATPMGFSLPKVNPQAGGPPSKTAWSDGDRLIQMLGAAINPEYTEIKPYINIIGAAEAGMYEYNDTTTIDGYDTMVKKAKSEGIESLDFPNNWKAVFPEFIPSQPHSHKE